MTQNQGDQKTKIERAGSLARAALASSLLCLLACADDAPKAHPPQLYDVQVGSTMVRRAAKAVVRIQHPAGLSGTGSFISANGQMLTNNHVLGTPECAVEGCRFSLSFDHQRGVESTDELEVFGVLEHADVGLDMAVLQVYEDAAQRKRLSTPDFLSFEGRDSKELIGTVVTAVGHPLGRLKKWSSGVVIDADGDWFESTVFSLPGSSGSPMLDDRGHIVGLLHRGSEGFDLLTRTGSNVSAIATAAAFLEEGLDAPLPKTAISLDQELTADEVLAHSDAFLAGDVATVQVDGAETPILTVLGSACDEGLARQDYASLEDLMSGLTPCVAALDFIECRSDLDDEPAAAASCPDDPDAWSARLEAVAQRQLDFNGSVSLSSISFGLEALAPSESEGHERGRRAILDLLDRAEPVYDFALAPYLAAFEITSYAGQSTVDLIDHYKKFPYYERSAWDIALSALWLYSNGGLERERALRITKELYGSSKIDLGSRLRIEEVLYNSNEL